MAVQDKCPVCNSLDIKKLSLPLGEEEFIYCNECKKLHVIDKVKIIERKNQ